MKLFKFVKTFALPLAILLAIPGCGTDTKSNSANSTSATTSNFSDSKIANDAKAIASTPISGEFGQVSGQLSLVGRTLVDINDDGDTAVIDVSWSCETAGQWTFLPVNAQNVVYATPNFTEVEQNYKLIGDITYGTANVKAEITGKIIAKTVETGVTKINALVLDQMVKVEGQVFVSAQVTTGFYVMDDTGTVFVYNKGNTMVTNGTKVKVEGKYLLYAGSYQKLYQIDASVTGGSVTTTDTTVNPLPFAKATSTTIANAAALKPTTASTRGTVVATREDYHKFYEIEGYLILYINPNYGTPTIEVAENNSPSAPGKYLAFYPASAGVETKYADIFGEFAYNSSGQIFPSTSKVGDGKKYKMYCVIYDHSIDSSDATKDKLRWLPVAAVAV